MILKEWLPNKDDNFWGVNREITPLRFFLAPKKRGFLEKFSLSIRAFIDAWKWH